MAGKLAVVFAWEGLAQERAAGHDGRSESVTQRPLQLRLGPAGRDDGRKQLDVTEAGCADGSQGGVVHPILRTEPLLHGGQRDALPADFDDTVGTAEMREGPVRLRPREIGGSNGALASCERGAHP